MAAFLFCSTAADVAGFVIQSFAECLHEWDRGRALSADIGALLMGERGLLRQLLLVQTSRTSERRVVCVISFMSIKT